MAQQHLPAVIVDKLLHPYNVETFDGHGDSTVAPALGGHCTLIVDELLQSISFDPASQRKPENYPNAPASTLFFKFQGKGKEEVNFDGFSMMCNSVSLVDLEAKQMLSVLEFVSGKHPERLVCYLDTATCDLSDVSSTLPPFRMLVLYTSNNTEELEASKALSVLHADTTLHLSSARGTPPFLSASTHGMLAQLLYDGRLKNVTTGDPTSDAVYAEISKRLGKDKVECDVNSLVCAKGPTLEFSLATPACELVKVTSSKLAWETASDFVRKLLEEPSTDDAQATSNSGAFQVRIPKPMTEFPPATMRSLCEFIEVLHAEPSEVSETLKNLDWIKRVINEAPEHPFFLPWDLAATEIGAMCTARLEDMNKESAQLLKKLLRWARCADYLGCTALVHTLCAAVVIRLKVGVFQQCVMAPAQTMAAPPTYPAEDVHRGIPKSVVPIPKTILPVDMASTVFISNPATTIGKTWKTVAWVPGTSKWCPVNGSELHVNAVVRIRLLLVVGGCMLGIRKLSAGVPSEMSYTESSTVCCANGGQWYPGPIYHLPTITFKEGDIVAMHITDSSLHLHNETHGTTTYYVIPTGEKWRLHVCLCNSAVTIEPPLTKKRARE